MDVVVVILVMMMVVTGQQSTAGPVQPDAVERELTALKEQVTVSNNRNSSSSTSSNFVEHRHVDDSGQQQQQINFKQIETNNGKLLKSIAGSLEKGGTSNNSTSNNDINNRQGPSSPSTHVHLELELPSEDVHDTYDNDNVDDAAIARLVDVLPQLPLALLGSATTAHKRGVAMNVLKNSEYQKAALAAARRRSAAVSFAASGAEPTDEIRAAIEQELQREWEMELEQEVLSEQQRTDELLKVLYVTSRVLLNFLNKEEQGVALRALGQQLTLLHLQSVVHPSTLAAAAEVIVGSLVDRINQSAEEDEMMEDGYLLPCWPACSDKN